MSAHVDVITRAALRDKRERAEAAMLAILRQLTDETGCDVIKIDCYGTVRVAPGTDEPRQIVEAVRIDLAV